MRVVNVILPLVFVVVVTLICTAVVEVEANAATLFTAAFGARFFAAVARMQALEGLLGFIVAVVCGIGRDARRTVSIEVVMQNSSLAVPLAILHLGNSITAIPGSVSATLHSLFGSILTGNWRWTDSRVKSGDMIEIESDRKGAEINRAPEPSYKN